jgi:broad specificity phosphatase PhoE
MNYNTDDIIIALRHFETKKNTEGIHGRCDLNELTSRGYKQAEMIASKIGKNRKIKGITYFDTPQAKKSAFHLSKLTQIPIEQPLSLQPYDMGIASGKTQEELKALDPNSAFSLELFRNRVIDATELKIKDSKDIISLEKRILDWWNNEGRARCVNRVVIGSNSTLIMLSNLFDNKLPSLGMYKCFGIPTGALRSWFLKDNNWRTEPSLDKSSWPEIICKKIHTKYGYIQTTLFHPGWENKIHTCIIAPGYFGNSRLGPYGLFVRLARALSFEGVECITIDYLGSGESSPINRTFEFDVFSIEAIISKILNSNKISIIGHSIGCSVIAEICRRHNNINGFALAPLCILDDLKKVFFSAYDFHILLNERSVIRKGVYVPLEYIKSAEKSWKSGASTLKAIILAEEDPYDISRSALNFIGKVPVYSIYEADHNFSLKNSSNELISKVKEIIIK